MAYVDKINVQGTDYDINDKRLPESDGTVILNKNFRANGISGSEIVERMTGYNFVKSADDAGTTKEFIYAGIVKNGNKLTFVCALNLTRTGEMSSGYVSFGYFVVPADIASKIYPTEIGSADFVDLKDIVLMEGFGSNKHCNCYVQKGNQTLSDIAYIANPNETLTLNQKYYIRYEVTLLLSDNLIQ